jgi:outer membrane protein
MPAGHSYLYATKVSILERLALPLQQFLKRILMMKRILLLSAFVALAALAASAQKYGHLNFGILISSLPETQVADKELEAYQLELTSKGTEMATAWQKKAQEFTVKAQSGELTPKQQQSQQAALEQERDEIIGYEQEMQQLMQEKRQELLSPIVEKVEQAIAAVAKENGYVMVFDTSVFNAILFAQESDDLLPLIKAQLNIE